MLAWWLLGGIATGWFLAMRLQVGTLCLFLVSCIVVPLTVFAVLNRIDVDVLLGYAAFCVAVQAGYLICNLRNCPSDLRNCPAEHGRAGHRNGLGNA